MAISPKHFISVILVILSPGLFFGVDQSLLKIALLTAFDVGLVGKMQISYPQVGIGHHSIEGNAAIGIPLFRPCRGGSFREPIVLGSRRPWSEKLLPVFGWH